MNLFTVVYQDTEAHSAIRLTRMTPLEKQQEMDIQTAMENKEEPAQLKEPEFAKVLQFRLRDDLIYFLDLIDDRYRLCIPESMEKEVFALAHDEQFHAGLHRTNARICSTMLIRNLRRHLRKYIDHCPTCQQNQTKRHSYDGVRISLRAQDLSLRCEVRLHKILQPP